MTRPPAVKATLNSIATPAAARPAVNHRSRELGEWKRERTHGLSLPPAVVALDPASSRPGSGPGAATHEDTLLRLALWLAEVATEAALAATAGAPRRPGRSDDPPVAESAP